MNFEYHEPVLKNESVDGLNIKPEGIYVDATFGGGGHSKEILKRLSTGKLLVIDQDSDALKNIEKIDNKLLKKIISLKTNYKYIRHFVNYSRFLKIDGIIADLGVSSYQFDTKERGFSYMKGGELDMRMNKKSGLSAAKILNEYPFEELISIFKAFGEINNAKRVAAEIVKERENKEISSIVELIEILEKFTLPHKKYKFFSKVFQALRIETNNELDSLKMFMEESTKVLKKGGRLSVISYHSLEDSIVKNFIKTGNFEGKVEKDMFGNINKPLKAINNKVIIPSEDEIQRNSRAASAKLRIAEKL